MLTDYCQLCAESFLSILDYLKLSYTVVPWYLGWIDSRTLDTIPKSTDAQVHYIKWPSICT